MHPTYSIITALLIFGLGATTAVVITQSYLKKTNQYLDYLLRHIWNSISLQTLINSPVPLAPPTGWAADSDILVELSRLVAATKPDVVVELGSGLSTIVIAATLRNNGSGQLISVEHDSEFATKTIQSLELTDLMSKVSVKLVPLRHQSHLDNRPDWYDISNELLPDIIDLVFVDGPPGQLGANIREPALEYFWPRLSADGAIVLDDADRPKEKAFIERWLANHPNAIATWPATRKGCVILSKLAQ